MQSAQQFDAQPRDRLVPQLTTVQLVPSSSATTVYRAAYEVSDMNGSGPPLFSKPVSESAQLDSHFVDVQGKQPCRSSALHRHAATPLAWVAAEPLPHHIRRESV